MGSWTSAIKICVGAQVSLATTAIPNLVESIKEVGTVFSFYLPFKYGVLDNPLSRIDKDTMANMRALIVDDDEVSREVLSRIVSSLGLKTAVAVNGKEAVNKVFETKGKDEK